MRRCEWDKEENRVCRGSEVRGASEDVKGEEGEQGVRWARDKEGRRRKHLFLFFSWL